MDIRSTDEGPLSSDELSEDERRDNGTIVSEDDAPGHTLPESERDPAKDDQKPSGGGGMPIMPPD